MVCVRSWDVSLSFARNESYVTHARTIEHFVNVFYFHFISFEKYIFMPRIQNATPNHAIGVRWMRYGNMNRNSGYTFWVEKKAILDAFALPFHRCIFYIYTKLATILKFLFSFSEWSYVCKLFASSIFSGIIQWPNSSVRFLCLLLTSYKTKQSISFRMNHFHFPFVYFKWIIFVHIEPTSFSIQFKSAFICCCSFLKNNYHFSLSLAIARCLCSMLMLNAHVEFVSVFFEENATNLDISHE